jgi:hypothetical protein
MGPCVRRFLRFNLYAVFMQSLCAFDFTHPKAGKDLTVILLNGKATAGNDRQVAPAQDDRGLHQIPRRSYWVLSGNGICV